MMTWGEPKMIEPGTAQTVPALTSSSLEGLGMAQGICSIEGCGRAGRVIKGFCRKHYDRMRRSGTTAHRFDLTPEQRFSERLVRQPSGCLEWTGATTEDGYGELSFTGKVQLAHRVAWTIVHGPIPDGLGVLHHCDNPPCCDTEHLFLGTRADNNRDAAAKGRVRNGNSGATHCTHGHEFTEANTYRSTDPRSGRPTRSCRACHRAKQARYVARRAN